MPLAMRLILSRRHHSNRTPRPGHYITKTRAYTAPCPPVTAIQDPGNSGSFPSFDENDHIGDNIMNIILNKEAPLELIRIIDQLDKDFNHGVENIIIDAFIPALAKQKAIGAYEVTTKTILIDLGNCLIDSQWMKYGMLYIPGVWLNAVVAVFHEFAHACQIEEDLAVAMLTDEDDAEMIQLIEQEAMATAMEHALNYFKHSRKTPPLNEMGWLGKEMAKALNGVFHEIPFQVEEELDALKSGAVASLNEATSALSHFDNDSGSLLKIKIDSVGMLRDDIDQNQGGVKIENRYYMTMDEFITAASGE
jgi:hypothetical protein